MAGTQQTGTAVPLPQLWWQRAGQGFRARRERRAVAHALYLRIVEQSRQPFLFTSLLVPDTREGRLEMVTLHAILLMRRLQAEGPGGRALAQRLFDVMFADVDQHLREWGVGDLSVGKHVKRVAQSFYARAAALEPGLADAAPATLAPILVRNVHGRDDEPSRAGALDLAGYLIAQAAYLRALPAAGLLAGRTAFAPAAAPAAVAGASALRPAVAD